MVPVDLKIYTPEEFENERNFSFSFLNLAMNNSIVIYERYKNNTEAMDK